MAVATEDMIAEMVKAIVDEVDPVQIIRSCHYPCLERRNSTL